MLKVSHLSKVYSKTYAVEDLSFDLSEGEVLGLLGPNGAGKTTTMRMICGTLSASSGEVLIDGKSETIKSDIGYLPEQAPLYLDMTVRDYLVYSAKIKNPNIELQDNVEEVLRLCALEDVAHKRIEFLSKGYRQRVGIAQAIVHKPKLIVLDEPSVGLDPKQVIEIRNLIKDLSKNRTIIISSHILSEIQMLCDRVVIINKGKLLANKTMSDLNSEVSDDIFYELQINCKYFNCEELSLAKNVSFHQGKLTFSLSSEEDLNKVLSFLIAKDISILSANKKDFNLETAYLKITEVGQ